MEMILLATFAILLIVFFRTIVQFFDTLRNIVFGSPGSTTAQVYKLLIESFDIEDKFDPLDKPEIDDFKELVHKGKSRLEDRAIALVSDHLTRAQTDEIQRLKDTHADELMKTQDVSSTTVLRRVAKLMLKAAENIGADEERLNALRRVAMLDEMDLTGAAVVSNYGKVLRELMQAQEHRRGLHQKLEEEQLAHLRSLKNVIFLCARLRPEEQARPMTVKVRNAAERDAVLLIMMVHDIDHDRPEGYWLNLSRGIKEVKAMNKNKKNTFNLSMAWIRVFNEALAENERLEAQRANKA